MPSVAVDFKAMSAEAAAAARPAFDFGTLSRLDDPGALESEWRAFQAGAVGHVFQCFDFVSAWYAHVAAARGLEPLVLVGRCRSGTLLFILPFAVGRRFGRRVVEWAGGDQADYHCGLFAPDFLAGLAAVRGRAEAFVEGVAAHLAIEADLLYFHRQPLEIGGFANPFAAFHAVPHPVMSHHTRLGTDWEAYYRAKRNSGSRRTDRVKQTRLAEMGAVRIFEPATPAETGRVMETLFADKAATFAARGIPNFLDEPGARDFCRAIALRPWPEGPAHVAAIEVAGEIIAANWGLVSRDRYYYVLHAYKSGEVARHSPGRQLMFHLMQWSIARGIGVFDFTIGDEDYKDQWCEESAGLADTIHPLRVTGVDLAFALRAFQSAKRRIKGDPRLRAAFEALRGRLAALRRG
jgi:CelD/BcsL family acetyltransferase involved in cellulose biosynthesis